MIIRENQDGTVTVSGSCQITGSRYSATVPKTGYDAWRTGTRIQHALPDVSKEDREWLVSGISPEGWRLAIGDDEDDVTPPDPTALLPRQEEIDAALIRAIGAPSWANAHVMVERGTDANSREGPDSLSVLEWAVISHLPDAVRSVIAAGADVNDSTISGRTALHLGVCDSSLEVVEILISAGADPYAKDYMGWTPLRWAVAGGHHAMVQRLITITPTLLLPILCELVGLGYATKCLDVMEALPDSHLRVLEDMNLGIISGGEGPKVLARVERLRDRIDGLAKLHGCDHDG